MAELEDVTLDGKPLHSLRVADLKAALEKRGLSKSGQKNALVKRLKGALMLENLQRTSTPHIGLQPNSQIGEEMSQNSIIKQYLAKQQELLRQRLEREAREAAEANEMDSQAAPQEDHEEGKLVSCPVEQAPSLSCALFSQEGGGGELEPAVVRAGEDVETGVPSAVLSRSGTRRSLIQQAPDRQMETSQDPGSQEALDVGGRTRRSSSSRLSHEEPPRAVASLSVRVLGEPEKEGPATAASASTLQFSHSAQATSLGQEESEDDDKSDADEEWSVGGVKKGPKQGPASSSLPPQRERSRRKQQPPQHIPPPQLPHQPQLQLRQPTPPPSPPPEHSFPLPDTPKQSPPNEPEGAGAAEGMAASPSALQRQDSSSGSSSSGSSSPEPRHQRRPGPLTLLARKMESEGAFAGTRGRSELEVEGHGSKSAPICTAAVSPTTVFPTIIQQETGVSSISHGTNVGLPLLSPTGDPVPQGGNGMTSFEATAITSLAQGMETGNLLSTPRQLPLAESIDIGAIGDEQTEGGESSRPKEDLENEIMAVEQGKPEEEGKRELGERAEESCFSPGRQIEVESAALEKAAEPLESQPPSAVSTQPPSKKLRFLRDMPVSSVPASASPPGKQARLSSDEPPGGQPVEHLPSPAAAEQDKDETCEASRSPVGETGIVSKPQAAEAVAACSESETTEAEIGPGGSAGQADAKMLKVAEEGNSWKGAAVEAPVGPVLPPSPPPEEGDTEQERERQSSPSSDSSDSDSESSSSHSSGSSASPVQHGSKPSDKMSEGTKDSKANSQPEASADTPGTPCLKRKGEQLEEHDTGGVNQDKKPCLRDEKRRKMENEGLEGDSRIPARELKQAAMSEPADSAVQVEAPSESEGTGVQSRSDGRGATESRSEESTTPKAFTARKISLNTANKPSPASLGGSTPAAPSPGGLVEPESGGQAARKRRWGSSTAVTAKKPSISITTDSLKSLIPDIKPATGPGSQEAVVELHPDEGHLSGDEEGAERGEQGDQGLEKGLKIRRTVTQVVPAENQENGQKDREEEEEEEEQPESGRTITEEVKDGSSEVSMETQASSIREADLKKVIPSDSLVRRSISQQKSGVSITIDDPVRSNKQPSPPRGKITNIVHICNLVRPFTLGQLKELLNRTGTVVEEGFWIDKIKSHCYVTYSSTEEAVATRAALHGVKWPQSNPKFLSVDFAEQDELDFHRGLLTVERSGDEERSVPPSTPTGPSGRPGTLPPLLPERQRERASGGVRDQWAEREREMERRERTRAEREWDRDKVREFSKPREEREGGMRCSRSRDRERRRKERGKSKERKTEKKEKAPEEPPAKLLDDLFCKTKTAPCIYWLPLTEEQAAQREAERAERMKEREKQRKKLLEEEDKKREEERKERIKNRDKEGGGLPSTGAGGASRSAEGERERDRARDREGDKRRDAHRSRGGESKPGGSSAGGLGGGRRSRSRSNPSVRERRR